MRSDTWVELLQKVPPTHHSSMMVVTSVGLEVSLQSILRMEEQYMVVRGRLAGTTDTGRIFFIPFDQINFLCLQKVLPASDISAMFGELVTADDADRLSPDPAAPVEEEDVEKTQPLPALPPLPVEEVARAAGPPRMSKAELLARIRSRSLGPGGDSSPGE